MRTVTLGALGAVAPVVPAMAPQYYGLGEATSPMDTLKAPTFWAGVGFGVFLGAIGAWWLKG